MTRYMFKHFERVFKLLRGYYKRNYTLREDTHVQVVALFSKSVQVINLLQDISVQLVDPSRHAVIEHALMTKLLKAANEVALLQEPFVQVQLVDPVLHVFFVLGLEADPIVQMLREL